MVDLPLQDIITAHTDALSAHAQEFLPTIRLLLLQGSGPVSPEQLATVMQWTRSEVGAFLRSSGLAPMLTGRSTRMDSTCPATGKEIRLTATPHGVEDMAPEGAVLSLRLPSLETSAGNAGETICAYGHFFVDREHASTWPGLHPDAVLLSVADAAHLAREIANAARRHAEKAKIR